MDRALVYWASYDAPYKGNFIASLEAISLQLKKYNLKVIIVLPEKIKNCSWVSEISSCFNEIYFFSNSLIKNIKLTKCILSRYEVSIIHTHFVGTNHLLAIKIGCFGISKKVSIVEHYHNHYTYNNSIIKKTCKKYIMKNDYIIGCGPGVAKSLKNGGLKNEIVCIDNAIDFSRFKIEFNNKKSKNFLMFGADFYRKGGDIALKAFEKVCKVYPEVKLQICVSVGMDAIYGEVLSQLKYFPEWVELLKPTDNIAEYYNNALAFVSPSREEGLCYALIEAAYCDCFVIASDISGQNELMIPDIIWTEPESCNDLYHKVISLLEMSEEDKKKKIKALKVQAEKNYSLGRWVKEMEQFYCDRGLI